MSSTGRMEDEEVGCLGVVGGENVPSLCLSVLDLAAEGLIPKDDLEVASTSTPISASKMDVDVEVDEAIDFGGLLSSSVGTSSTMTGRPSFGSEVVAVPEATEEDVHQAGVMDGWQLGTPGPAFHVILEMPGADSFKTFDFNICHVDQEQSKPETIWGQVSDDPSAAEIVKDETANFDKATWTQVYDPPAIGFVHPEPRDGHRAVSYGNLMIVFGGGSPAPDNKAKVHVFDTSKNLWFQPQLSGDIPCERAAFGMALDGNRILVHGGITGDARLEDDLYQLSLTNWEWRKLNPVGLDTAIPCGRRGHSFTFLDGKVYLFGGLTIGGGYLGHQPSHLLLNDLHILHVHLHNEEGLWTQPFTHGLRPPPRESHSAVAYTSAFGGYKKLILYGGTGQRGLLGDVHLFDVASTTWTKPVLRGSPPSPISLHSSATMIGDKMYVFGGMNSWLEEVSGEMTEQRSANNTLACLNVEMLNWEDQDSLEQFVNGEPPPPRAGHSAVFINNSIYILSGNSVKTVAGGQACFSDLWKLEFPGPRVKISWNTSPNAVGDIDILTHDKIGEAESIATLPSDLPVEEKEDQSQSQFPSSAEVPTQDELANGAILQDDDGELSDSDATTETDTPSPPVSQVMEVQDQSQSQVTAISSEEGATGDDVQSLPMVVTPPPIARYCPVTSPITPIDSQPESQSHRPLPMETETNSEFRRVLSAQAASSSSPPPTVTTGSPSPEDQASSSSRHLSSPLMEYMGMEEEYPSAQSGVNNNVPSAPSILPLAPAPAPQCTTRATPLSKRAKLENLKKLNLGFSALLAQSIYPTSEVPISPPRITPSSFPGTTSKSPYDRPCESPRENCLKQNSQGENIKLSHDCVKMIRDFVIKFAGVQKNDQPSPTSSSTQDQS